MTGPHTAAWVLTACLGAAPAAPPAPGPRVVPASATVPAAPAGPWVVPASATVPAAPAAAPTLSDVVAPGFRDAVMRVVRQPTLTARGTADEFTARPELYAWMLEHPDRVALAWRRLKVPCVEIGPRPGDKFAYTDENGSEVVWQAVGRFHEGLVWYATGKVKPSVLLPSVPVKAVAVIHHPTRPAADGAARLSPATHVYIQTDSRTAGLVLRMLGPSAPKMAEQGAEQLLFFFNGIARYVHAHPEQGENLLAPAGK